MACPARCSIGGANHDPGKLAEVNEGLVARMTHEELALIAGCSTMAISRHARHSTAEIEAIRQRRAEEADPRAAWRHVMAIAQAQNDAPTMKACQKELDRLAARSDANKPKPLRDVWSNSLATCLGYTPASLTRELLRDLRMWLKRTPNAPVPLQAAAAFLVAACDDLDRPELADEIQPIIERFLAEIAPHLKGVIDVVQEEKETDYSSADLFGSDAAG